MSRDIVFGEIDGIREGHWFAGRKEMMDTSFHRNWARGIDGDPNLGAAAICLSGGYEDDEDDGDVIIYTGAGGQDSESRVQIKDQTLDHRDNQAIFKSLTNGTPIRVIRGSKHKSDYSPKEGYIYSGLYNVTGHWLEKGKANFMMIRFRFEKTNGLISPQPKSDISLSEDDFSHSQPERRTRSTNSIVRNPQIAERVKTLYNNCCQICGIGIKTYNSTSLYSEAAHIKPLGHPHNGNDDASNILCLCPNHHKLLDYGGITITPDFKVTGTENGTLNVHPSHKISPEALAYHKALFSYD